MVKRAKKLRNDGRPSQVAQIIHLQNNEIFVITLFSISTDRGEAILE